jgi:hypothetical protein
VAISKRRAERAPPLIADVKQQSEALRLGNGLLLGSASRFAAQ